MRSVEEGNSLSVWEVGSIALNCRLKLDLLLAALGSDFIRAHPMCFVLNLVGWPRMQFEVVGDNRRLRGTRSIVGRRASRSEC